MDFNELIGLVGESPTGKSKPRESNINGQEEAMRPRCAASYRYRTPFGKRSEQSENPITAA